MKRLAALLIPVLALPACVNATDYGGDNVHEHIRRALPAAGVRSIRVENVSGPVTIAPASGNAVTIDATKNASDSDAIARTHVDITRDGDQVAVRTRYDENGGGWFSRHNGASVTYDIRVPATLDVDVANVTGSVTISGTAGNVRIEEISGPVRASIGRVSASRLVHISSVSGPIDVVIAKNSDVRVDGKTVSGPIRAFFPADTHKGFVGETLDGRVGSGSASMSLEAVSGSITISPQ